MRDEYWRLQGFRMRSRSCRGCTESWLLPCKLPRGRCTRDRTTTMTQNGFKRPTMTIQAVRGTNWEVGR